MDFVNNTTYLDILCPFYLWTIIIYANIKCIALSGPMHWMLFYLFLCKMWPKASAAYKQNVVTKPKVE